MNKLCIQTYFKRTLNPGKSRQIQVDQGWKGDALRVESWGSVAEGRDRGSNGIGKQGENSFGFAFFQRVFLEGLVHVDDQFAHDGGEGDFGRFALVAQLMRSSVNAITVGSESI